MKICVSAQASGLDAQVDPRFGRCQYFTIVDTDTMACESLDNAAIGAAGGAGIQAAQAVANRGASVVLTGNVGPNAYATLQAAGITIVTGATGTVREAVEAYKSGALSRPASGPTVGAKTGMGGAPQPGGQATGMPSGPVQGMGMGRGMGQGMGMGRGMGQGRGMGRGMGMGRGRGRGNR